MPGSPDRDTNVSTGLRTGAVWLFGHASRFLPLLVVALVVYLTWDALRELHPTDVLVALRATTPFWIGVAAVLTLLNIGVMGLYDVVAFRQTRASARERWWFGSVAFAWSNFLTLGPFAGPAIRFWLYKPFVDHGAGLETGVTSTTIAFISGLGGWTLAAAIVRSSSTGVGTGLVAAVALLLTAVIVYAGRRGAAYFERFDDLDASPRAALGPALIGWLDWLLAALVFVACVRATAPVDLLGTVRAFFLGQAVGLASLIPGGFGSSDAFWIAHLPQPSATVTAALVVYRLTYYIVPWAGASLVLLSWATSRASRRVVFARRLVAGLVAGGGCLMLLSTASPALLPRLRTIEEIVPLPIVEASHIAAALTGLLLLLLARGLAKGYRAAIGATILVLALSSVTAVLKGLDYEEALILAGLAVAAWSQTPLFDRRTHGHWFNARDLAIASLALFAFLAFGAFTYRITPETLGRVQYFGYRYERARYLRTASTLALAVTASAVYLMLRVPVRFRRLDEHEVEETLELHAAIGRSSSPLMVANGDKAVFRLGDTGFCLYRTIGPYLSVFSDPVVASSEHRDEFLDALFEFAEEIDRRLLFYQVSLDWIPPLHDRGYAFFKLGEEALVRLNQVSLDGPQGKLYRQILRRGERDRLRLRILAPYELESRLPELREISDDWLQSKGQRERQFSIGFFDETYLRRFPCAVIEQGDRLVAFANLLRGPRKEELSIDLMRYRSDGPSVMDFLFVSLFFWGKDQGYRQFNMGMAPLSSVGRFRGAHGRERLANLLFQHGENWYNFQGLRFYKDKFEPDWVPRYMAYQNAWEWPAAVTNVSPLVGGGWGQVIRASTRRAPSEGPESEADTREDPAGA